MTSHNLGVIIVTYNSGEVIGPLLDSLSDGLRGCRSTVIIVDNDSADGTTRIARRHGYRVVDMESNLGYAAALNRGFAELRESSDFLILNPDVTLARDSAKNMLAAIDASDTVGVVVPQMRSMDRDSTLCDNIRRDATLLRAWALAVLGSQLIRRSSRLSEFVVDANEYQAEADIDWASGAVLLISGRCLARVGAWDESYFLYSEETDFCLRARAAGFVVRYVPQAVVRHKGGGGVSDPRLRSMMVVNRVRLYRRTHRSFTSWLFYIAVLTHQITRGLAGNRAALVAADSLWNPRHRPPEISASGSRMPS